MIGIFDSGYGGLTVFKEVVKILPQYSYIYLGDNARAPYGDHSQEVIYGYTKQAVDYLISQGCHLILIACNTASAEALPKLQQEYEAQVKILGVIRPTVEMAVESGAKRIGVLGTRSTVASGKYKMEAKLLNKNVAVEQLAAPLLVPLIEEGVERKPWSRKIIKNYVNLLKSRQVDTVILGCTHYGLISDIISHYFGRRTKVLDASAIVANKLADYLQRHPEVESSLTKGQAREFLTTDDSARFDKQALRFLGQKISSQQIKLI